MRTQLKAEPPTNRTGLPDQLKSGVENLSGLSLDDVKVHYNSAKPAQLNALAYAQGADIHVAPGQEKHLPHEAWHIVQQKQGRVKPTMQMKTGTPINDEDHLEREADRMGSKAMQMYPGNSSALQPQQAEADGQSLRTIDSSAGVAQRVRGGLEFTEDTAVMDSFPTPAAPAAAPPVAPLGGGLPAAPGVARSELWNIHGAQVSCFLTAGPPPGRRGGKLTLMTSGQVALTNDERSAEWIITRHGTNVSIQAMRDNMNADLTLLFAMRTGLVDNVNRLQAAHAGQTVVLAPGNVAMLHAAPDPQGVFVYVPGTSRGKAQITIQYNKSETIKRINLLNASKFLTGTKVAPEENVSRVTGAESAAVRAQDLAGTTQLLQRQRTVGAACRNIESNSGRARRGLPDPAADRFDQIDGFERCPGDNHGPLRGAGRRGAGEKSSAILSQVPARRILESCRSPGHQPGEYGPPARGDQSNGRGRCAAFLQCR